ncbi:MAG: mechanosensitive ion channel family protein [candidate division NC10 bacterium]|nr:mechanosensitive ion channel family protein [candidate division NC10 bacterium]
MARPPFGLECSCALWPFRLVLALTVLLALVAPAGAAPAPDLEPDPLGRTTPRGTVLGFIRAAARGDDERAAQYLDTRRIPGSSLDLARQLKVVLDRSLHADLDSLSNRPEGSLNDELAVGRDRVGVVKVSAEPLEILLDRVQHGQRPPIWLFSAETLRGIPQVYNKLRDTWFEELLPGWLAGAKLLGAPLWQWMAFLLSIPLAIGLAWPLNRLLLPMIRLLLRRIPHESEDRLLGRIARPLRLLVLAVTIQAGSYLLPLSLAARQFWTRVSATLAVVALSWILLRMADIVTDLAATRAEIASRPGNTALLRLVRRLAKAAVFVAAGLVLLYRAGVDLTAALAGLGLGGLALAFSAQKTLENLFGGIMLISDQTLRVGDFCRVGNHMGTVEDIGLRATRLRTLERTLINIPNGQLSTMDIENFAWRDKILFRPVIGLRCETTPDQLRYVVAEIRRLLYAHPKVETESARVRFVRLGASSLDIEIQGYIRESDFTAFLAIQEDLLLRILEIVEASGTHVAFLSRITYLSRDAGLDPAKRQAAEDAVRIWREARELPFPDYSRERIDEMRDTLEYPPGNPGPRPPGGQPPTGPPGANGRAGG